jgi:two-component system sensor histidine kinase QseC
MKSIRRRMLTIVLGLFVFAWTLMAVWTWNSSKHEIEEVFDAQLAQAAVVLLDMTRHEIRDPHALSDFRSDVLGSDPIHHYEKKIAFQVWNGAELWFRSASAPEQPMAQSLGYSDGRLDEEGWRFLLRMIPGSDVRIIVGERYEVRDEMIHNLNLQTVVPMLAVLPLLGVMVIAGIRRGLTPLPRLTRQIRNRSSMDLQPVELKDVPEEIRDVAVALNALLARLHDAFQTERRFTADAAHELRTPLAVIRAQSQLAQRLEDSSARSEALSGVVQGVDRATRLVSQLLTLARVDSAPAMEEYADVDFKAVIKDELETIRVHFPAASIHLNASLEPVHVQGLHELLAVLVRNLLENAVRYARDASSIDVSLVRTEEGVELRVEDDGPGIPADQMERVQERFVRLPGHESEGSGLGLSIVRRIAELHAADVVLSNREPHGLCVSVQFDRGLV